MAPSSASASAVARPMPPAGAGDDHDLAVELQLLEHRFPLLGRSGRAPLIRRRWVCMPAYSLSVSACSAGMTSRANSADVLLRQVARQRGELQQAQEILEAEQAVAVHELLAHGVRAAAEDDALLDQGIDGVLLAG